MRYVGTFPRYCHICLKLFCNTIGVASVTPNGIFEGVLEVHEVFKRPGSLVFEGALYLSVRSNQGNTVCWQNSLCTLYCAL